MLRQILLVCSFFMALTAGSLAQTYTKVSGYVEQGGQTVTTSGLTSTTKIQRSYPGAAVTVYQTGTTTLATIYADTLGTLKANPFTADNDGYWFFYAGSGTYDVKFSGGGIATPFTRTGYKVLGSNTFSSGSALTTGKIPYVSDGAASSLADSPLTVSSGNVTTAGYVQAAMRDKGGQVFDIRSYGAVCDGSTSDQTAIDSAYAAAAAVHGVLYIPPSTSSSACVGHITIATYGVTVRGAGAQSSFLKNTDTTKATIELDASSVNLHEVRIEGLALVGAGSGASNHGIYAHGAALVNNLVVRDVNISNHGGRGVYDLASFTSNYENMLVAQPAGADNAFEVLGANDSTFKQTYVTTVATNKAAYRVYSGSVSFIGANGINSGTNADWAVLGRTVADDGVDSYVQATFISTNIENFTNRGVRFKTGSFGNFFSTRITAPASGTVTPLSYQFVDNNSRGIFDAASSINTQGASYTNGAAVNSSGAPFLQVGNGDLTQYYDTAITALIGLPNLTVGLISGSTNTALLLSRAKVTALEDSGLVGTVTGANDFAGNASRLLLQNGSVSRPVIGYASGTTTGMYFDGSNQPAFTVGGTQRLTIGSASQFTGSVGINTAPAANYSLDVAGGALRVVNATGSSTATGDFQGDNNPFIQVKSTAAGTTTGILQAGNNTNLIFGTSSNHSVEFRANNTARWYLQASTGDIIPAVAGAVNLGQTGTRIGGVNAQTGNFSTSLTVGSSGTAVTRYVSATGTVGNGGANIAAQSCITDTITVTGAASGDIAIGTPPSTIEANLIWNIFISAADTVKVQVCNPTSGNIASADLTWRVGVIKH